MSAYKGCSLLAALCVGFVMSRDADAQSVLPNVKVIEHTKVQHHGGYVISGDFQVDPKMSAVIFPTEALHDGDILSVQPLKLRDDEYFVLQECASADCTTARILRVWGPFGATTQVHDPNRMFITHEGKYFLWMKQIEAGPAPSAATAPDPNEKYQWFTQFQVYGLPLVLTPIGLLASTSKSQLEVAEKTGPMPVKSAEREEGSFIATFATGTKVRIKRMHADN
jgi:hypothetical protein